MREVTGIKSEGRQPKLEGRSSMTLYFTVFFFFFFVIELEGNVKLLSFLGKNDWICASEGMMRRVVTA